MIKPTSKEICAIWDDIADFWDQGMGLEGNAFHQKLVVPATLDLLNLKKGETILDFACGSGQFARKLCRDGYDVTAFDISPKLIEIAKKNSKDLDINYHVLDGTNFQHMNTLGCYDKVVANMALMDIGDMSQVFQGVYSLLKPHGIFVFSIMHPCFNAPGSLRFMRWEVEDSQPKTVKGVEISSYIAEQTVKGAAMAGQPRAHFYFNRPLSLYIAEVVKAGFVLTALKEPVFKEEDYEMLSQENLSEVFLSLPPIAVFRVERQDLV